VAARSAAGTRAPRWRGPSAWTRRRSVRTSCFIRDPSSAEEPQTCHVTPVPDQTGRGEHLPYRAPATPLTPSLPLPACAAPLTRQPLLRDICAVGGDDEPVPSPAPYVS